MTASSNRPRSGVFGGPSSLTASTFGGGISGNGFDLIGLGEGGLSLISTQNCNQKRYDQRYYLAGKHQDRSAHAACRHFEHLLVLPVLPVQVASCPFLHLAQIPVQIPRGLKKLAAKKAAEDASRQQSKSTFSNTHRIRHGGPTERDRNNAWPMPYDKSNDGNNDRGSREHSGRLLAYLAFSPFLRHDRSAR